jgi:threonine dehydrogenase-like Zn-dependent dehydrogenase
VAEDIAADAAQALWYVGPGTAQLRPEEVAAPGPEEVQVRALAGAISRGTERLVFQGRVPASEYERMRGPFMGGTFPFPVKYGYAIVGRVEAGAPDLVGQTVFALHPHQSLFTIAANAVTPVPPGVPSARAVLAANMETALNALWDGSPSAGDRIAIVGGGVVGLLLARLCARLPGAEVTVIDLLPARAEIVRAFGARFALPETAQGDCDVVFHASGSVAGLTTALRLAGDEASVVELSWYGAGNVAAPLGEAFHSRRLRLVSSQVGRVAPSHRPRWTVRRRLAAALKLAADPALDALLTPTVRFDELAARLPALLAADGKVLCPLIRYAADDDAS